MNDQPPSPTVTVELDRDDIPVTLNKYLALDWVIILHWISAYEGDQSPHILVGWPHRDKEPVYPPQKSTLPADLF